MGKDSLIKSTAKKSETEKEKAKSKKKSAKKAAAKSTAPKKASANPAAAKKSAKKQTKATKTAKATKPAKTAKSAKTPPKAAKTPAKKPTLKELLFKKFDGKMPPAVGKPTEPDLSGLTAPPFIDTDDPAEAERLRELLSKKFDMADIKASAKPPEAFESKIEPPTPAEPEPAESTAEVKAPEAETSIEMASPVSEPEPEPGPEKAAETKVEEDSATESKTGSPAEKETAIGPSAHVPPVEMPAQPEKEPVDPVLRAAKIGAVVAAAVVLMIIWASFTNSAKYFITSHGAAVEIEKGNFSPTGRSFFAVLHGYQLADPIKEEYRRNEIFPIIFGYYLNKADTLLEVAGLPDYKAITDDLEKAEQYALTTEMRDAVRNRITYIQRMTLLYKAEVEASKTDIESLESALKSLDQVKRLTSDPAQLEVINQKTATVAAALEAAKLEREKAAAAAEDAEETEETTPEKPSKE